MTRVLSHVGLTVTDMDRSRRFYEGAFGMTYDRDLRMEEEQLQPLMQLDPPSKIHAVYLMIDDFTLELMQWQPGAKGGAENRVFLETGLTHLSFACEDIPGTLEKVEQLGGTVLKSVGRAAMLRDPDGQLIELVSMEFRDEVEKGRAERKAAKNA